MTWDETLPENDDQVRDFGTVVRSHKTEFRAGIERHFRWRDSSGASAGEPRLMTGSVATQGSCRAFYGTGSQVSAHRDGALMVTSDTSRLYGLTSSGSALLGSYRAVHLPPETMGNHAVLVQQGQVLTEIGTSLLTDKSYSTQFPIPYGAPPTVLLELGNDEGYVSLDDVSTSGFTVTTYRDSLNLTVRWRSAGTVSIGSF